MSVAVVIEGNPRVAKGKLDPGGGRHLDRVTALWARLRMLAELAGTRATPIEFTVTRDASQGTEADLLAFRTHFGTGRAERNKVKLHVILIDDVRRGAAAEIGRFVCREAVLVSTQLTDAAGGPVQTLVFRASKFRYVNAINGTEGPEVDIPGFVEEPD